MTSRVVKIIVCDRCGDEQTAEAVASDPSCGWVRVLHRGGRVDHLCAGCYDRALKP